MPQGGVGSLPECGNCSIRVRFNGDLLLLFFGISFCLVTNKVRYFILVLHVVFTTN